MCQCSTDLNQLPACGSEFCYSGIRIETEAMVSDQTPRGFGNFAPPHKNAVGRTFAPQVNIFGHGHVGCEQGFLVNHRDAVGRCFGGFRERDGLAAPQHLPTITLIHASNDFHQGRLASAVFAHQKMDFTFLYLQIS
jgi:hypothetical protein